MNISITIQRSCPVVMKKWREGERDGGGKEERNREGRQELITKYHYTGINYSKK